MNKQQEALKLALEALRDYRRSDDDRVSVAMGILQEALAEQPAQQQEPVCDKDPQGCWSVRCQLGKVCKNTSPPASKPWVGLTDEEWQEIDASLNGKRDLARIFTRAIEAKLKEKNHG